MNPANPYRYFSSVTHQGQSQALLLQEWLHETICSIPGVVSAVLASGDGRLLAYVEAVHSGYGADASRVIRGPGWDAASLLATASRLIESCAAMAGGGHIRHSTIRMAECSLIIMPLSGERVLGAKIIPGNEPHAAGRYIVGRVTDQGGPPAPDEVSIRQR